MSASETGSDGERRLGGRAEGSPSWAVTFRETPPAAIYSKRSFCLLLWLMCILCIWMGLGLDISGLGIGI